MSRSRLKAQALAEFTAVLPILILLIGGIVMACFYGYRSAAADWGIFINGVAAGSFDEGALGPARSSIFMSSDPETRSAQARINIENSRVGPFGADLTESYRASVFFRLWRFYAGPQGGGIR
jgi:hypothetical protein